MQRFLLLIALTMTLASAGWLANGAIAEDENRDDVWEHRSEKPKKRGETYLFLRDGKPYLRTITETGEVKDVFYGPILVGDALAQPSEGRVIEHKELRHLSHDPNAISHQKHFWNEKQIKKQIDKLEAQARESLKVGDKESTAFLREKIAILKAWKPFDMVFRVQQVDAGKLLIAENEPIANELDTFGVDENVLDSQPHEAVVEDSPNWSLAEHGKNDHVDLNDHQKRIGIEHNVQTRNDLQGLLLTLDREVVELAEKGRKKEAEQKRRQHRQLKKLIEKQQRVIIDLFKQRTKEEQRRRAEKMANQTFKGALKSINRQNLKLGIKLRRREPERVRQSPEEQKLTRKIEHLQRAEENLQQAGMEGQADGLRRQADEMQRELDHLLNERRRRVRERRAEHGRHEEERRDRDRRHPQEEIQELLKDLRGEVRGLRKEVREMHEFIEKRLERDEDVDDKRPDDDDKRR